LWIKPFESLLLNIETTPIEWLQFLDVEQPFCQTEKVG